MKEDVLVIGVDRQPALRFCCHCWEALVRLAAGHYSVTSEMTELSSLGWSLDVLREDAWRLAAALEKAFTSLPERDQMAAARLRRGHCCGAPLGFALPRPREASGRDPSLPRAANLSHGHAPWGVVAMNATPVELFGGPGREAVRRMARVCAEGDFTLVRVASDESLRFHANWGRGPGPRDDPWSPSWSNLTQPPVSAEVPASTSGPQAARPVPGVEDGISEGRP